MPGEDIVLKWVLIPTPFEYLILYREESYEPKGKNASEFQAFKS